MTNIDTLIPHTNSPTDSTPFFTLLADKYNSGEYAMDSTVLAAETKNKVWKIYDSIDRTALDKYHHIHNGLSKKEYTLKINGEFEYQGTPINDLVFSVHHLGDEITTGSDLSSRKNVIITELEYVPGTSLGEGMIHMPKNFLSDQTNDMYAFLREIDYELFGSSLSQLRPLNIKVKKFDSKTGTLSLIITDLGGSIDRFVELMEEREKQSKKS